MNNKKNVFLGLVLILLAVYVIVSKLGLVVAIPAIKIVATVFMALIAIDGIKEKNFFKVLVPIAIVLCLFDEMLNITAITPWPLLIATVLVSIGLEIIFKKDHFIVNKHVYIDGDEVLVDSDGSNISTSDGIVRIENGLGNLNEYVDSQNFSDAQIENGLGCANVYFNNADIQGESATIRVENGLGTVNLYLPKNWVISNMHKESVMGQVRVFGSADATENIKKINMIVENGLGTVSIYY